MPKIVMRWLPLHQELLCGGDPRQRRECCDAPSPGRPPGPACQDWPPGSPARPADTARSPPPVRPPAPESQGQSEHNDDLADDDIQSRRCCLWLLPQLRSRRRIRQSGARAGPAAGTPPPRNQTTLCSQSSKTCMFGTNKKYLGSMPQETFFLSQMSMFVKLQRTELISSRVLWSFKLRPNLEPNHLGVYKPVLYIVYLLYEYIENLEN